jgi:hypothetical protein
MGEGRMSFPLRSLMPDTVTIEPCTAESSARVLTFGAAVTYPALIEGSVRRVIGKDGREVVSNVRVTIPERVAIDMRSRVTLPSGFSPQTPPILAVEALRGLGLDHTVVHL